MGVSAKPSYGSGRGIKKLTIRRRRALSASFSDADVTTLVADG
jgi:hypothetical protein